VTKKLPRITAAEAIRALEKAGFFLTRQSGSHKIYKNVQGRRATVPYHSGKILHPKVLKSILRDADLTLERFKELMG
jgi:predicted RNA binding protein YcfA (HicA-like mRNA interferase family)